MRKSSGGVILSLLVAAAVGFLSLYLFQSVWLKLISRMLNSNQSAGLPTSSTPISGFSFPTRRAPAPLNKELTVGNLGITVTGIVSPADAMVGKANRFNVLEKDEEYLVVYIKTRCVSKSETCRLTEFDFGVHSEAGRDYPAELSGNYSDDLKGLFEGGDIPPGQNLGGSLIFIIRKGDRGLTLVYPRLFSFGDSAEFLLGK
jgi:Domain of unknown function (DUF4352)